jgi:hypothetical protein
MLRHLISWFWRYIDRHRLRRRKVYDDLFIETVALMIHARNSPRTPEEARRTLAILIRAAMEVFTSEEWREVVCLAHRAIRANRGILYRYYEAERACGIEDDDPQMPIRGGILRYPMSGDDNG